MRRSFFTALASLLLFPALASAQALGGSIGNSDSFSVSLSPQYPVSQSTVTLSFVSSAINLANTTLSVSVGGKQMYQGTVQPVSVPVGKVGSVTTVTITMDSAGARYTKSITLQPQDVSLIAEPLSSAPVLYPGKPLVPMDGNTRVVAIANIADAGGRIVDPATLSYTWTVDGAEIANSSGIGKQAIIIASPFQYRARDVSVLVQSQMGNLVAQAAISLSPEEPGARIYENDPLLGIRFERALSGSYTISGTEATLYAAPFSLPLSGGPLFLRWFLNGAKAQTGNLITLRPTGSGEGSASLSFTASSADTSLAGAATSLSLIFGKKSGFNFFGL